MTMRKLRDLDRTRAGPRSFGLAYSGLKCSGSTDRGWRRCMMAHYSSHRADTRPVIGSKMLRLTVNRFLIDIDNQGPALELYKANRTSAIQEIHSLVCCNSRKIRVIF